MINSKEANSKSIKYMGIIEIEKQDGFKLINCKAWKPGMHSGNGRSQLSKQNPNLKTSLEISTRTTCDPCTGTTKKVAGRGKRSARQS